MSTDRFDWYASVLASAGIGMFSCRHIAHLLKLRAIYACPRLLARTTKATSAMSASWECGHHEILETSP